MASHKVICPSGNHTGILSTPFGKNICLSFFQKSCDGPRILFRQEGRFGRSSRNVGQGVMDAGHAGRCVSVADGKDVWSWRPDAGVKPCARRARKATEAIKPGTPGRARHKP